MQFPGIKNLYKFIFYKKKKQICLFFLTLIITSNCNKFLKRKFGKDFKIVCHYECFRGGGGGERKQKNNE